MRKLTLLSVVFLLGILLTQVGYADGTFKYTSKPHLPVVSAQTTLDAIYVPVNVPVADVRVALYIKSVMYSTLRITLVSPRGRQVVLKAESGNIAVAPLYGSIGAPGSLALFQQGGNAFGAQPNNIPLNPATPLASLNGDLSSGWWTLRVQDERNPNAWIPQEGFLEEWHLYFNRQIIEPIQPFNPPVNYLRPGGATLFGQINGSAASSVNPLRAQIPNEQFGALLCNPAPNDPNVVLGRNGDAFPVIISGHPGALVGQAANGYPAGRFRITISVETQYFPGSPYLPALTEDIAIYFGKVPDAQYSPPLPAPPASGDPGFQAKNPSGWPTGAGTVNTLLGGASGLWGGVRLTNCLSPQPGADDGGYDRVTFDDFALEQIASNLPAGPSGGFAGTYKPLQNLSTLNGLPVDGLYYVSVYDCFGDAQAGFGHIRVTYLQVEYIVGGGEISDPVRHQGFNKSLAGVPVPGTFTGAPLGYLTDVVGAVPPYKENSKDQDPILVFWATQKMYPQNAVGTERIQAVNRSNVAPASATHYHGPYAYPASLDSDPTKAGAFVNADVLIVPNGDYRLRVNMIQPRYDDDLQDNEFNSAEINVNPVSMSYFGEQIQLWNKFVDPARMNLTASFGVTPTTGIAQSFTLFKFPFTKVTSVDYKFDGQTINDPRSNVRISVWRVNGITGYTGAPATLVSRSTTVNANGYVGLGNWRTFALYPVDGAGNPDVNAGGSVNLSPGTYVFVLDNVGTGNFAAYPYTYGAIPALKDRYWDYIFGDNFGPLGPFSTLGTRMGYYSGAVGNPPTFAWGATTGDNMSNCALPMRVNMTAMNDFGVNFVRFSSQSSPTEAITIGQPVTPSVNVSSYSSQGGLQKDFNIYLGIYDQGNNLIWSDMVNVANAPYFGIGGYQTLTVNMDSWTPQTGGLFNLRAYFTRNPDDQNPINDRLEYTLYIQNQPVIAFDNDVDRKLLNEAVDNIRDLGAEPTLVDLSQSTLKSYNNSTIYFVGSMNSSAQAQLTDAVGRGNDIAFVYERNAKPGATIRNIDNLYGIERASAVDYDNVELLPTITAVAESDEGVRGIELPQFTSKEELMKYVTSTELKVDKPLNPSFKKNVEPNKAFENALPVALSSKFGNIRYQSNERGNIGIVYTIPSSRKAGSVVIDEVVPSAFALEQNYPNPFNPTTAISYTLPEASLVTLRVLDLLGREVATLVSESQNAGSYTVSFKGLDKNGKELTTGAYLYRLEAVPTNGGTVYTSTKKMLLSK
jgi:subtilisin-like proprotein convertase family protein